MGFRPGLFRLAFFAGWKFSITGPEQMPLLDPEYFPRLQFLSHRHPRYENFPSWPVGYGGPNLFTSGVTVASRDGEIF